MKTDDKEHTEEEQEAAEQQQAKSSDGSQTFKNTRRGNQRGEQGKNADGGLEEQQQAKKEGETPSSSSRPRERTPQEAFQTVNREEDKATKTCRATVEEDIQSGAVSADDDMQW